MRRKFSAANGGGELRRGGFADPEHLNLRRVEAALAAGTQKERHAFQRVFLFVLSVKYRCHSFI